MSTRVFDLNFIQQPCAINATLIDLKMPGIFLHLDFYNKQTESLRFLKITDQILYAGRPLQRRLDAVRESRLVLELHVDTSAVQLLHCTLHVLLLPERAVCSTQTHLQKTRDPPKD